MFLGIDVSKWQGNIDWNKAKKQIAFAIVRAGFGNLASQKDSYFEVNYKNAKSAGVPIGCYWYSYAKTPDDARREADAFLEVVKGKKFEYPIYYDIEESDVLKLGEEKVSAIAKAFLEKVEKAGYWVGLYMSASYLNSVISADIKKRYAVWVAHYTNAAKPSYNGSFGMWQYTSKGKVDGISGDVDMNRCYCYYEDYIRNKGLNGFKKGEVNFDVVTIKANINGNEYSGELRKE